MGRGSLLAADCWQTRASASSSEAMPRNKGSSIPARPSAKEVTMEGERKESDLSAELRALAENLKSAVQTAWHSDERKNLQGEIEEGLASVGEGLREGGGDLS